MGLSWFVSWKLHNSVIYGLQLCKYKLKWNCSWNGQISIKEWKDWENTCRISFEELYSDAA